MAYQQIPIKASSNIATVAYDPETKSLLITFIREARQYRYDDVDANTAEGFRRAESPGRYFIAYVKDLFFGEEV